MSSVVLDPSGDVIRNKRRGYCSPQARFQELRDRVEDLRHDLINQVGLGGEVISDDALAHTSASGDLTHRRALEPEIDDRVDRATQQLFAALALSKGARIPTIATISTHGIILVRSYDEVKAQFAERSVIACIGRQRPHPVSVEGTKLDRVKQLALDVSPTDFDRIVVPESMVGNPRRDLGLEQQPASAT
jgi:hypothetical protein